MLKCWDCFPNYQNSQRPEKPEHLHALLNDTRIIPYCLSKDLRAYSKLSFPKHIHYFTSHWLSASCRQVKQRLFLRISFGWITCLVPLSVLSLHRVCMLILYFVCAKEICICPFSMHDQNMAPLPVESAQYLLLCFCTVIFLFFSLFHLSSFSPLSNRLFNGIDVTARLKQ